MRVAIIGAGHIGVTLGRAWVRAGHEVRFGVRVPEDHAGLAAEGATVTTPAPAIVEAEVVLLATPAPAVGSVLRDIAQGLGEIAVVDATNNLAGAVALNARTVIADLAPDAVYCRAFNTLGWENFANPSFADGQRADLFFACPEGWPRECIATLASDVGLRPVWVGGLEHVETVDGMARLWFALVLGQGMARHTAFRMLGD